MHMRLAFNRGDHGHPDVGEILQHLCALIVHLAPHAWIGHVAEGSEVDPRNELAAGAREDHDLIRAVLGNSVESLHELGVIPSRECQRAAPRVKCRDEDARGVPRQLQAAVGIEIVGLGG